MVCIYCSQRMLDNAQFCHKCGKPVAYQVGEATRGENNPIQQVAGKMIHDAIKTGDVITKIEAHQPIQGSGSDTKRIIVDVVLKYWPIYIILIVVFSLTAFYKQWEDSHKLEIETSENQTVSQRIDQNNLEGWLSVNKNVFQGIAQNNNRLRNAKQRYVYYATARDVRVYDRVINSAKKLQQQISDTTNSIEIEKIRGLTNKLLSLQIKGAEYGKSCIQSNKTEKDYLQSWIGWDWVTPDDSLVILLRKHNMDVDSLWNEADTIVKMENY